MIDAFQIATQGLGPGWSTFHAATMGFGFEVEIIIKPTGGGGGGYVGTAQPYEVIVRIKYKGKTWEQKRFVSALSAKSLEKVLASFKSMKTSIVNVFASINNVIKQKISIFVKPKDKL